MVEFPLKDTDYSVVRPKLRKWLALEGLRNKVNKSADGKDKSLVDYINSYLSALLDIPEEDLVDAPWYEVATGYYLSSIECAPKLDLSIMASGSKKMSGPKELPEPWDYEERSWYSWVHMVAKAYGWSVEYISDLDVDDALALIQEISLDAQFQREWEWGITEIAYEPIPGSKGKQRLKKLPRPAWMGRATQTFKKALEAPKPTVRVNPAFIPPGVIIYDEPDKTINNAGGS